MQSFSGCETKINCLLPGLCRRCCDDQISFMRGKRVTCNLEPHRFTHQCYRCSGCLMVSNAILANQTNCMAETAGEDQKGSCFTYRNATMMVRGCYYKKAYWLNGPLKACMGDTKNCDVCTGHLCNGQAMISYCYQCTFGNHNCGYDQRLVGNLQMCRTSNRIRSNNGTRAGVIAGGSGCYSIKR